MADFKNLSPDKFIAADVVLTRKPGNFASDKICLAQTENGQKGKVSHATLCIGGLKQIESTVPFTDVSPVTKYLTPEYETIVVRYRGLSATSRIQIVREAFTHRYEIYPFWNLGLFLVDIGLTKVGHFFHLVHKNRDVVYFTRKSTAMLTCSRTVAEAFVKGMEDNLGKYMRFGVECVDWQGCTPDHLWEDAQYKKRCEVIWSNHPLCPDGEFKGAKK